MTRDIKDQIAEIREMSRARLVERWSELYGRPAPPRIRRELLIPFLIYRVQELAFGGLSSATRARLKAAARSLGNGNGRDNRPQVKAGTQFLRTWSGTTHVVSATETGFDYRGKKYRSLSQIARLITGTRWSGPAFFGLKKSKATISDQRDQTTD